MESYLFNDLYDLVTPDGAITKIISHTKGLQVELRIESISAGFVGFQIDPSKIRFNMKSTLAQLGVDGAAEEITIDRKNRVAELTVNLFSIGPLGHAMLEHLKVGTKIGKLFAADERRRVRSPDYLFRMFGRSDRWGRPLLLLGGMRGSDELTFETVDGRCIAYLALLPGVIEYDQSAQGFLSTISKALQEDLPIRNYLRLHQRDQEAPRLVTPDHLLLVKTAPLHVRTVFAHVVNDLLPQGYTHTSASLLQPDTAESGDVYEFYGHSKYEITDVPLEFYTLEPHREHVFFSDRDQLQASLEDPESLFSAFTTVPPESEQAAVFVVKGEQLLHLKPEDWVVRDATKQEFPGMSSSSPELMQGVRQSLMVERYMLKQAAYPFLEAIVKEMITSQGVLFTRYFPSPILKPMLLSASVHRCLKGIYFTHPSYEYGEFFSYEDRSLLIDLAKFAIPVYWVDPRSNQVLQYVQRPSRDVGMRDTGMFVPLEKVHIFTRATFFGLYGSNLLKGSFESELTPLLEGLLAMKNQVSHPLFNAETPLAMVTGGGPGVMEIGNQVAQHLGLLSCANIVDFSREKKMVEEQRQNPFIDAKMTYRLDKLVERQAEFHLDFPIFLQGGIGTDFELALEEVRRKTGDTPSYPVLLLGPKDYWNAKISSRFQCNRTSGTIAGSAWVSNTLYCAANAAEGLEVYRRFLSGQLAIGKEGPIYEQGFACLRDL